MTKATEGYEYCETGLTASEGIKGRLFIFPKHLEKGIDFAKKEKIFSITIGDMLYKDSLNTEEKENIDLEALLSLPEIEILMIDDSFKLREVLNTDALYHLKSLKRFISNQSFDLDISKLCTVEWLEYNYTPKFKNLETAIWLKSLAIKGYKANSLEVLKSLEQLEYLQLVLPSIQSIAGIENSKNLKSLFIIQARKLDNIQTLNQLNRLETLALVNCPKISHFDFELPSLLDLEITSINNLTFLKDLPNLQTLKFQNIEDGNLTPLLESNLKRAYFSDKKHYSHKMKEINHILSQPG